MKFQNLSVLVVEDDEDIRDLLLIILKKEGFKTYAASNGSEALVIADEVIPDLILLDRMMPVMDGIEAFQNLSINPKLSQTKIIFLTAMIDDNSQIEGLDIGADDYLMKPIKSKLLIAKLQSIMRNTRSNSSISNQNIMEFGNIKIDNSKFLVWKSDQEIKLPRKEFELLFHLMKNANNVVRREEILKKIWGAEVFIGDRTIDVHVRKIREKIGDHSIETVKGIGYKFVSK